MQTFSKILIFLRAIILWFGIWIALWTTLLAPLPMHPKILISCEAHLYVFSESSAKNADDAHFCIPSSLMLYILYDLLSKFTAPPSDSWSNKFKQNKKHTGRLKLINIENYGGENQSFTMQESEGSIIESDGNPFSASNSGTSFLFNSSRPAMGSANSWKCARAKRALGIYQNPNSC